MVSSVKMAKEELERIISLCLTLEKTGSDPFNLDIKALLNKLRTVLEKSRNLEIFVLDAETLYRIALVIALQHKWLKDRASSLFVDSQLASLKIVSASVRELAAALASCWRPIVSLEQLTRGMVSEGLEYFLSLPTRMSSRPGVSGDELGETVSGSVNLFEERQAIEEEIRRLHGEMLAARDNEGYVDYLSFVKAEGEEKVVERAYITAFLVSEGYAELVKNPLTGEIRLQPFEHKLERRSIASLTTVFRGGGHVG